MNRLSPNDKNRSDDRNSSMNRLALSIEASSPIQKADVLYKRDEPQVKRLKNHSYRIEDKDEKN